MIMTVPKWLFNVGLLKVQRCTSAVVNYIFNVWSN